MSRWDDALREALRREEPPDGFAERVMARVKVEDARQATKVTHKGGGYPGLSYWLAAFRRPHLRWATALAGVVLAVGAVEYRNQMERRAEGERARDQVMLALRITGGKLRLTQAAVQRVSYRIREQ
jgi:negative regulator of sigma E activity